MRTTKKNDVKITHLTTAQNEKYVIRPYESSRDEGAMKAICEDVWRGKDYLPSKSKEFETDTTCDFVVMTNESDDVVALGNRRIVCESICSEDEDYEEDKKVTWIEAIRVSSKFSGKGIATDLLGVLINRSIDDGITRVMSCTIDSNIAMKKVFKKVNLQLINQIHYLDFQVMAALPGWRGIAVADDEHQKTDPESILKALKIEEYIQQSSRLVQWKTVSDEAELVDILQKIEKAGGLGYLPGIGKVQFLGPQIRSSLDKGLIRTKLGTNDNEIPCVYGLIEEKAIQSLRSKWVCCISGNESNTNIEAALWDACSDHMVKRRGGEEAFSLLLDGLMVSTGDNISSGNLISKLPIKRQNPFNIYSN